MIFYVGSYAHAGQESIKKIEFDEQTGEFKVIKASDHAECPSYVITSPDNSMLYAVRELTEEGAVYAFRENAEGFEEVNEKLSLGKDPCFLSLDPSGKYLYVVNYSSGNLSVFAINADGSLGNITDHIQHNGKGIHPTRQEEAHVHCAVCRNGFIYVCDLGMDRIFVYGLNEANGKLSEKECIAVPAGAGPRHLLFSDEYPEIMYVVGELSNCVYVYDLSDDDHKLLQTISTLPEGFDGQSTAAAIRFSADKSCVFVSNRGDDSIIGFKVLGGGRLKKFVYSKCGGRTPRDFAVVGNMLVVANQSSDEITLLDYDPASKNLGLRKESYRTIKPTCIAVAEEKTCL